MGISPYRLQGYIIILSIVSTTLQTSVFLNLPESSRTVRRERFGHTDSIRETTGFPL